MDLIIAQVALETSEVLIKSFSPPDYWTVSSLIFILKG